MQRCPESGACSRQSGENWQGLAIAHCLGPGLPSLNAFQPSDGGNCTARETSFDAAAASERRRSMIDGRPRRLKSLRPMRCAEHDICPEFEKLVPDTIGEPRERELRLLSPFDVASSLQGRRDRSLDDRKRENRVEF